MARSDAALRRNTVRNGLIRRVRTSGSRAIRSAPIIALAAALIPIPTMSEHVANAAGRTFVVNSTADLADAATNDDICSVIGAPTVCTLRAALQQANASVGHDRIEFSIPGVGPHRFTPASPYAEIVDNNGVTIDGYSQAGSAMNTLAHGSNAVLQIELQGLGPAVADIDGLHFRSAENVVRGVAIFDFQRNVRFWGPNAHDNVVVGNFIGTDAAGLFGQSARVISNNGIHLERGAAENRIGLPGRANRNVLSGNGDKGVAIYDNGSDGNMVMNNVVGLSPTGDRLRNWGHGVDINFDASDNIIGGVGAEERNVVSGNELSGVEISHDQGAGSTNGNQVIGNLIGTNLDGTAGSSATRNHEFGVNLEGKPTCPTTGSCGPDISDNLVEANTIVGSAAGVMIWKGTHNSVVRNNRIGLLEDGTIAASSVQTIWGVLIEAGAFDNLIDSNVIAGVLDGIQVRPDNHYTDEPTNPDFVTDGNTFRRNSIWGIVNGFGIDIAPISSVNDTPDELSVDVQGAIEGPTIVTSTEDLVEVAACIGCLVELFLTDADIASAYGQGRTFVDDAVVGPSGIATLVLRTSAADPSVLRANDRISATATDAAGNTSEFSRRVAVRGPVNGLGGDLAPARRCGSAC